MNTMLNTIQEHGIDYTAEMLAEYINQKIESEDVAIQFVLEELEAASMGNEVAKIFAETSGFDEDDYMGAMYNSFEKVDGADGPQQEILNLCMMLYPDQQLMAELRIKTVDNIMKKWELGKYAAINNTIRLIDVVKKNNNLSEGIFANINNDLNDSIKEDHDIMLLMAYGYARRTVAAGLYLQGVFNKAAYQQASNIFKSLQLKTGQSIEFQEKAAEQANQLLISYDARLSKDIIIKITTLVEQELINEPQKNQFITYEDVLSIFLLNETKSNLVFLDLEYSGMNDEDRIIQLEYIIYSLEYDSISYHKELCNGHVNVKFIAMEIHHITQEMLIDKPKFHDTRFYQFMKTHNNKNNYLIGHYLPFKLAMLEKENFISNMNHIDTKMVTSYLFPDLSHTRIQFLRYALGLYKTEREDLNIMSLNDTPMTDLITVKLLFMKLYNEIEKVSDKEHILNIMTLISSGENPKYLFHFTDIIDIDDDEIPF